ncbi:hypothetical protein ACHAWT_010088 [Skeletonema menzelii]
MATNPSMPPTQDPNTPKEWEAASSAVLNVIRCFVDGLRSAPCLKAPNTKEDITAIIQDDVSLFGHLQSMGVVERVQSLNTPSQPLQQQSRVEEQQNSRELQLILLDHYKGDDRKQILHQIIHPLLKQLQKCYAALDTIESSMPPSKEKSETKDKTVKGKRKNAAPPPLGMLSLNDYVNVACLLEFTVSISLIPALEYPYLYKLQLNPYKNNNVGKNSRDGSGIQFPKVTSNTTTMAQKRIQALPKPLAGRISRAALTWGSTYAAKKHDSLHKTICDSNNKFHHNSETKHITPQQLYYVYSTYQAYTEITSLATSIGQLVLLDRFRPMLLPRHLSDIYLGLYIAERLRWVLLGLEKNMLPELQSDVLSLPLMWGERDVEKWNSSELHSLERALLFSSLKFHSSLISKADSNEESMVTRTIDHREAALACRTLLSGGAAMNNLEQASTTNPSIIPPWLRMRLGQFLTTLAGDNLQSVVDVFVAYAHGHGGNTDGDENGSNDMGDEIMTGAAARLARALCAKPAGAAGGQPSLEHDSTLFIEKLCNQFVEFLVDEGQQHIKKSKETENYELVRSRSSVAMSLTLWSTIGQLSMDMFLSTFVRLLSSGLFPREDSDRSQQHDAIQSTAAIGAFLATTPSSLDPSVKEKLNAMLVSPLSNTKGCNNQTLLGQILRLASFFCEDTGSAESKLVVELDSPAISGKSEDTSFLNVAVMTIIQTVQVITRLVSNGSNQREYDVVANALLKAVSVNPFDEDRYSFDRAVSSRNGFLNPPCYIVAKRGNNVVDSSDLMKGIEKRAKVLVHRVIAPLSQTVDEMTDEMNDTDAWMRIVPSSLFRLVLQNHFSNFNQHNDTSKQTSNHKDEEELRVASTALLALLCEECSPGLLLGGDNEEENGVLKTLGLILESGAALLGDEKGTNSQSEHAEEVLSTASIVLSLLVAILELGAEKRSESGEVMFQSMMPSLRTLSCGGDVQSAELSSMVTELAEMASHALALVAARNEVVTQDGSSKPRAAAGDKSDLELIVDHITEAEHDLESSQPPLRAKGVVTLRHIARSLATIEVSHAPKKSLVIEVDSVKTSDGSEEQLVLLARTLARICLIALADSESYVYLASIHTLVAISDVCPSEIITLMGTVVSKGTISITVLMNGARETPVEMSFVQEQRIKAVEALIFIIRRRGDGIFLNGPSLLETMLFGQMKMSTNHVGATQDLSQLIQLQTHEYFQRSQEDGDDEVEARMRIGTGGPVFSCEEDDLLRSAAISLVCELISTLHPAVIAQYCHALVRLASDALQLESSRPVRRSAALLARELYACVMREETADEGIEKKSTSAMAIAMVCAGEDKLVNALTRCVTATDVDVGNSLSVKAKSRLVDPATQSRSKEALVMRGELEIIFQMAAVVAKSMEREAKDPAVEAVRKALSESI